MKRILPALLILIAASARPAAAELRVPICPPSWMMDLLRGHSIAFSCSIEDYGAPVEDGIIRGPRTEPVELPSDIIPMRRELARDRDGRDAYREFSTDGAADHSAGRPAGRVREASEAQ